MNTGQLRSLFAAALALLPAAALAGPPLLCHPVETGGAPSLPWGDGDGWRSVKTGYPALRAVDDSLALLNATAPVLARMETLRRAALYVSDDATAARLLSARLVARARDAETAGKPDALARFDAGYFAECLKQTRWLPGRGVMAALKDVFAGPGATADGYEQVRQAIGLRGGDPAMEFAAALISLDGRGGDHEGHVQRALAGAIEGSPLARNLLARFGRGAGSLADLRAGLARAQH